MREAGYIDAFVVQAVGDVVRGGLTVDRGAGRQDHFGRAAFGDAGDQGRDIQLIRADAIQCRERAAQNVIAPFEACRAFKRPQVGDVFDDT